MKTIILGSTGFIGSALTARLMVKGVSVQPIKTSAASWTRLDQPCDWLTHDLRDADTVYLCAGRTGGVGRMASDPMSFVYPNVRIQMNVMEACAAAGVRRLVMLQSTTGYRATPDPMHEEEYLDGELHPAYFGPGNAGRFIDRVATLFKSMEIVFFRPSNVYGPRNDFDPITSHVIEATIRKVAERQNPFVIWGTGDEVRDATYIDDLAEAMSYGATCPPGAYNVGTGDEMSVKQMVGVLLLHAKFEPEIVYDASKPSAIPARRVNVDKLRALGWKITVPMPEGLRRTYDWFVEQTG